MDELLVGVAVYLIGAGVHARAFVWNTARQFPTLKWEPVDTAACVFFSLIWPIVGILLAHEIYRMKYPATPRTSLFARWHANDLAKSTLTPNQEEPS